MSKYLLLFLLSTSVLAETFVIENEATKRASAFPIAVGTKQTAFITNAHACIKNYSQVVMKQGLPTTIRTLTLRTNKREYVGTIASLDIYNDLCMFIVNDAFKPYPFGVKLTSNGKVVTPWETVETSNTSKDNTKDSLTPFHQNSYKVEGKGFRGGYSGSPVLNEHNGVMGVFWATDTRTSNVGYFVGLEALKKFYENSMRKIYVE